MKKTILVFNLLFYTILFAQNANRIKFEYDSAGNQTRRYICLCSPRIANDSITKNDTIVKTIKTVTEKDMIQDSDYEQLTYYPNPVVNELYIKWKKNIANQIIEIQTFSMNGQLLKSTKNINSDEIIIVSFQDYPIGIYNLVLVCENGEKKALKIVKE